MLKKFKFHIYSTKILFLICFLQITVLKEYINKLIVINNIKIRKLEFRSEFYKIIFEAYIGAPYIYSGFGGFR